MIQAGGAAAVVLPLAGGDPGGLCGAHSGDEGVVCQAVWVAVSVSVKVSVQAPQVNQLGQADQVRNENACSWEQAFFTCTIRRVILGRQETGDLVL